jgi:hypothetical protein
MIIYSKFDYVLYCVLTGKTDIYLLILLTLALLFYIFSPSYFNIEH